MSGSINQVFTIDAAPLSVPVVTSDAPAEAGYGQTVQIGTIAAADGFNQLSVIFVGNAPQGTLSINAEDQVLYTAPTNVLPGEVDNFTYEIEQSTGGVSAPVSVSIALDEGPIATDRSFIIGQQGSLDLSGMLNKLATPGLAGDTLTLISASAAQGTIVQQSNGDYVYEPVAGAGNPGNSGGLNTVTGTDTITYTVADQLGDTVTGTAKITIDPGPILSAGTTFVAPGQSVNLASTIESLIEPGLARDTETITSVSAQAGQISASTGASGQYQVEYTAPLRGGDTITYTVQDEYGDQATGSVTIVTEPSLTATDPSLIIGHAGSIDLSGMASNLATSSVAGDSLRLVSASAAQGTIVQQSNGDYVYEPLADVETDSGRPIIVPVTGTDTITYKAVDQYGYTVTGMAKVTIDPGPILSSGTTVVAPGVRVNLASTIESLIAPGLPGDTETITALSAQAGQIGAFTGASGQYQVEYTAPASGDDTIFYTVKDQYGDKATGTVAVVTDPGPTAGNVLADVTVGQSVDLTQQILGADQPGLAGATLTLTGDDTQGTMGTVSLVNGDLVYTASTAAFASLGAGASTADSFAYTVSDQYGEQATGTVTLDVSNPVTTVNGNPYGGATIEAPAGNATINAFGYGNSIYANGGNDTINAGAGSATVYAGSGNVTVNLNGYGNVVSGGNGTDAVSGGLGNATVTLGNGNDTVNVGGYGNSIVVGNGNDTIAAGAGSATVAGGSGTDIVTLQGYQDSVSFAGGNDTITGGAGSDTYDLTGGNASLVLNGYNDMVFLHSTNATVADAGQGAVISIAGGGTDIVQGAASDPSLVVDLTGGLGGFTSASSVLASLTSDGNGGALLSFGASHGSLDFVGVAPSALHAANFQIG